MHTDRKYAGQNKDWKSGKTITETKKFKNRLDLKN